MANRILTDERILAREQFVTHGLRISQIARNLGVKVDTVRAWAKKEAWVAERREVIVTTVEIARDMKSALADLVRELRRKQHNKEPVTDKLILRIERCTRSLSTLNKNYDDKGMIMLTMTKFTDFLEARKAFDAIKVLRAYVPDFYESIRRG